MTPQELKNSILQLAVQGKLVEQREEEGTGEELYRQIQKEKTKLIKEGKIKKEKPLPEITEDEIPFDIPERWRWVRVAEIASIINGDRGKNYPAKSTLSHKGIPFISAQNLDGNTVIEDENLLCLTEQQYDKLRSGKLIKGDIVVCIRGSLGKHGRYPFEKGAIASSLVIVRQFTSEDVLTGLFMAYLDSPLFFSEIRRYDNGTAQPNLAAQSFEQFLFPLPPLAEQKRIVAKIEELLPYIDRYEEAWSKLEDFNARFPGDMQKSLLQYAIQGKLVEQRAEEGTGEELYRQIQKEKAKLIREGKIKKEKPLPEISEDEIPFDIPEGWKWVRLPSIASLCLGKMLDRQKNTGTFMHYLRNVNVQWGRFNLDDILEMKFENVDSERFLIRKGDLVMCEGGEPGRCAVWQFEDSIHFQKALHRIRFFGGLNSSLYQFFFRYYSDCGILNALFTGTTIKHLTGQALEKIIVPLPPLAEQKRIVAKLEELLPLCEKLK
ncbi:MAG: restriction endonuclease [Clostridiales bacterium]|nr:restriction endonuclease [Clostridiales bacterium]